MEVKLKKMKMSVAMVQLIFTLKLNLLFSGRKSMVAFSILVLLETSENFRHKGELPPYENQ